MRWWTLMIRVRPENVPDRSGIWQYLTLLRHQERPDCFCGSNVPQCRKSTAGSGDQVESWGISRAIWFQKQPLRLEICRQTFQPDKLPVNNPKIYWTCLNFSIFPIASKKNVPSLFLVYVKIVFKELKRQIKVPFPLAYHFPSARILNGKIHAYQLNVLFTAMP